MCFVFAGQRCNGDIARRSGRLISHVESTSAREREWRSTTQDCWKGPKRQKAASACIRNSVAFPHASLLAIWSKKGPSPPLPLGGWFEVEDSRTLRQEGPGGTVTRVPRTYQSRRRLCSRYFYPCTLIVQVPEKFAA